MRPVSLSGYQCGCSGQQWITVNETAHTKHIQLGKLIFAVPGYRKRHRKHPSATSGKGTCRIEGLAESRQAESRYSAPRPQSVLSPLDKALTKLKVHCLPYQTGDSVKARLSKSKHLCRGGPGPRWGNNFDSAPVRIQHCGKCIAIIFCSSER